VSCPPSGLIVDGDADQIDRVLVNLLSNAVKYTPKGGQVRTALACDGDSAMLTVADTGISIPAQGAGTTVTVRIALAKTDVPPARTDRAGGSLPG
jgi:signal transduction histidine kinase